jgi:hypothetical protein
MAQQRRAEALACRAAHDSAHSSSWRGESRLAALVLVDRGGAVGVLARRGQAAGVLGQAVARLLWRERPRASVPGDTQRVVIALNTLTRRRFRFQLRSTPDVMRLGAAIALEAPLPSGKNSLEALFTSPERASELNAALSLCIIRFAREHRLSFLLLS